MILTVYDGEGLTLAQESTVSGDSSVVEQRAAVHILVNPEGHQFKPGSPLRFYQIFLRSLVSHVQAYAGRDRFARCAARLCNVFDRSRSIHSARRFYMYV